MKTVVVSFLNRTRIAIPPSDALARLKKTFSGYDLMIVDEIKDVSDAEIIACFGSGFDPSVIPKAKNLKWVHSFAAGVDQFLVNGIKDSNILLTNSSGVHPIPIAEHAFAMLLSFERGLHASIRNQSKSIWDPNVPINELSGKTILVVGAGRIGSHIGKVGEALGLKSVGVSLSGKKVEGFSKVFKVSELGKLLPEADYIVSVVPLTKDTFHLFGKEQFGKMKKSALFVNVGRGKNVDENSLIDALKLGKIRGACLDVFEEEPLPKSNLLWKMENVIMTPHTAGNTPYYAERALEIFCENFRFYNDGKKMPNLVDKELGY